MKSLILSLIIFCSCVSPARNWHVDNVNNAISEEALSETMRWLEIIWKPWPVNFSVVDTNDGVIEINCMDKGNHIGLSFPGKTKLRGPKWGVFSHHYNSLDISERYKGKKFALLISHEIGHAYGLSSHKDSGKYIMSAIANDSIIWHPDSIEHFNKFLGFR